MNSVFSTGLGEVADLAKSALERVFPDPAQRASAELAVMQVKDAADARILAGELQMAQMQADINKTEATSSSVFVAGWRPFAGWVCGVGLGYVTLIDPMGRFIAQVMFGYTGAFPVIDTTITMQALFGMLGLAAARSYDKKQGTETKDVAPSK